MSKRGGKKKKTKKTQSEKDPDQAKTTRERRARGSVAKNFFQTGGYRLKFDSSPKKDCRDDRDTMEKGNKKVDLTRGNRGFQ